MKKLPDGVTARVRKSARLGRRALEVATETASSLTSEIMHADGFAPQSNDDFVAAAYFASGSDSVYQLEQWLWPFEQLAARLTEDGLGEHPFGIITRDIRCAQRLRAQTDLPVRFSRMTAGFDRFMSSPGLRLVFYVNQATGNFQALRFPRPAHVHLSHGESEKISMISNQLKAYDYVFTAGQASRDRIDATLIGLDPDRLVDVGRPQLDRPRRTPVEWQTFEAEAPAGPTVFYAPTWEGDSPSMAYGTLAFNGEAFVTALFAAGYRVIFRPHPRTGALDPKFAKALAAVEAAVDSDPRGLKDKSPDVSWQLGAADIALAEMSSVAFDWLSASKPLVMIAPHNPDAEVLAGGLFDRCPVVSPGGEHDFVGLLKETLETTPSADGHSRHYLGATGPGEQIERFIDASHDAITTRSHVLSEREGV